MLLLLASAGTGWLAGPGALPALAQAELHVSLFGQPCLLQGPPGASGAIDERALKIIHALSPEQLYPAQEGALASLPTRKALDKLRATTGAPAALDRYRERLGKRLEAQLAFLEALEAFRKEHQSAVLTAAGKAHLKGHHLKEFEAALKKAESAPAGKGLASRDGSEAVFDAYNDGIEADPEEEFHRAIQRINVQYACSFEESGADDHKGGGNGGD